jgi:hypothetical protein
MGTAKLIRYEVGRREGRSSLFFEGLPAVTTKRPLQPSTPKPCVEAYSLTG